MKQLIVNLVAFLVIGLGSISLMQTNAQATSISSATALAAQCPNGTCGATCGSAEVPILGEVCVCTGECPESDEPEIN